MQLSHVRTTLLLAMRRVKFCAIRSAVFVRESLELGVKTEPSNQTVGEALVYIISVSLRRFKPEDGEDQRRRRQSGAE
jgi:hypothetical protein